MTLEIRASGFLTRFDTNRPLLSQKKARSLKLRIQEEEKLYYLCSKNKGIDQLRLYFRIDKALFSHYTAHLVQVNLIITLSLGSM